MGLVRGIWWVTPYEVKGIVKRSDSFFGQRSNLPKRRMMMRPCFLRERYVRDVLPPSEILGKNLSVYGLCRLFGLLVACNVFSCLNCVHC
jgi:hypothetical protein